MDFLCTAVVQELGGFAQLGAADDRVVNQQQALVFNELMNGDQLHFCDQIPAALYGGHERAGPGGGVFDKGTGEGNTGSVGIADCMSNTGIRYTGHGVRMCVIPLCKQSTAGITHLFHADAFIGGRRVAVIDPQEGTDLHILAGLYQCYHAFGGNHGDFAGAQILFVGVFQIQIGKALKGNAIAAVLFAYGNRSAAQLVTGSQNSLGGQEQHGHGAVDDFLCILNAFDQVVLLVDNGSDQFRGVDVTAAHLQKMGVASGENLLDNLIQIVDLSHSGNGIGAVMGAHNQRLGLIVGNTSDAQIAVHFTEVLVELGAEGGILDIMYRPVEPLLPAVNRHSGPAGSQMGMIVGAKEQVKHAVVFRSYSKVSAHRFLRFRPGRLLPALVFLFFLSIINSTKLFISMECNEKFSA